VVLSGDASTFDSSHFEMQVSNDAGASWTTAERLDAGAGGWIRSSVPLAIAATPRMKLRVRVKQDRVFGPPGDTLLEGLIDDVRLYGYRYLCDAFTPPAAARPNPVGDSVTAERHAGRGAPRLGGPPADAGHGAATSYRVYRSASPSGGFALGAQSTAPFHVAAAEAGTASTGTGWSWRSTVAAIRGTCRSREHRPPDRPRHGAGCRIPRVHGARRGALRRRGWVRNLSDGSVEIAAQRAPSRFFDEIALGPRHGRVTAVDRTIVDEPEYHGFDVRR